ncbi:MAG TPA: ferritin-like domain-containing protein [Dongiaceae bacterium]|nr:ferritin-like domain-containing protein [Dongiaceae bacterium]
MVTTAGTEDRLESLLSDLIQLDYDAAAAYQAASDRLENAGFREHLGNFRQDHLRHTRELGEHLSTLGHAPPREGDAKGLLTKGKVVLAGMIGDKAILQAMKTNEDDTNTAYERAVQHRQASASIRETLERGLSDERRHRDWMVTTIERL